MYRGLPKGELGQFADLRGNLAKRGVVFLRGIDTPLQIMECFCGFMSVVTPYSDILIF